MCIVCTWVDVCTIQLLFSRCATCELHLQLLCCRTQQCQTACSGEASVAARHNVVGGVCELRHSQRSRFHCAHGERGRDSAATRWTDPARRTAEAQQERTN